MLRGIYSAAASMLAQEGKVEVSANNLANVDTTAFKRELAIQGGGKDFPITVKDRTNRPLGPITLGSGLWNIASDIKDGTLKETGLKTHIAISGRGFFSVLRNGKNLYTRSGAFLVNEAGFLSTLDGGLVLGKRGTPIYVGDEDFKISENGAIYNGQGNLIDELAIVDFPFSAYLNKVGTGYLVPSPSSGEPFLARGFKILQGYLEGSNVKVVEEMINLISATRSYERAQKIIQIFDDTLGKSVNEVGKI